MAMCNISSKYKDIISKSALISSGPPAVYQLTPNREKFGTLTRKTVGEKKTNKTNKTILLVGETGTGKSTLINALINYTMGVEWEDEVWFEIVEDEKRSQCESQTSDVIVYEIFGFEGKTLPYSLTIIDTPGYGDTRGIQLDAIVRQRLLDLFRSDNGVHELDAVGLVLKAAENRVSDRLRYVFDSVVSLFGKDIEKNIVALITHSDGVTPKNALEALKIANIKCAKNHKDQLVHFLFANCQNKPRTEEEEFALQYGWRVTERGMGQFKDFLGKSKPQQLETTVEVLNSRIRLAACINNLQDRIKLIELKQNEIKQTEEVLKKYEQEMKNNKEFNIEVPEVYKVKEDIDAWWDTKAVCCKVCEETCHYPGCTWALSASWCEVMKGGYCTSCTRRCAASHHVRDNWRYVSKTRKVQKTLNDVKKKYEENKSQSDKKKSLMENLQTTMEELKAEKIKLLDESYQHLVNLEQIALNVNSASTHVHLDFLIEKMEERKDTEKVKKLKEMRSRVDEGTKSVLQYMFGKRAAAGKAVKGASK